MLETLTENQLCEQLCTQVKMHRLENGMVMLQTPFSYPDGDLYPLYLSETATGSFQISDGGHTLMHLSYENDVDIFFKGSRGVLLGQIVFEHGITYNEKTGEFLLECSPTGLADATFRLGQGITRVCDLTFLNKSKVASTFYEDLKEQIFTSVSEDKIHEDFEVSGVGNPNHYPVDFCIDGKGDQPLFLFGIPSSDKARLTTIFLQHYLHHEIVFDSMLVFQDQAKIPRKDLARLSNVGGEMISSLNAEDDFRRKLLKKAA